MLPWERFPRLYRLYRANPLSGIFLKQELRSLRALLKRTAPYGGMPVLDIGCGTGYALGLLPSSSTTVAVDIRQSFLTYIRERNTATMCVRADAQVLPFRQDSFAMVLMIGVTEYLPDMSTSLRSVHRNLVPGGYLLVTFARPHPLNTARRLLGYRIHTLRPGQPERTATVCGFNVLDSRSTLLQYQYLLSKQRPGAGRDAPRRDRHT